MPTDHASDVSVYMISRSPRLKPTPCTLDSALFQWYFFVVNNKP